MTAGIEHFLNILVGTVLDILPIAAILFGFQIFVLRRPLKNAKEIGIGFLMVLFGLALFLEGLDLALFPLGELMASQLTSPEVLNVPTGGETVQWHHYFWVYLFAASIGFSTTIAEPSLIAVAIKANQVSAGAISQWGLRIAVAIGVAIGIALGSYRIITG
ncbi:MAG: DUF1538 domain-containing protein, partial [Candidatus Thiodiazotropha taylori]|nr:DUF1538 domain-containing protein [Candidatus Thiodiazotropha taylori]MCW4246124.1 DUF1538 domain-containing protein [Candidatus Thiodiazotropha taylori]